MKVLHVYRTYFPDTQGGVQEVIRQICINTKPHGIENRVFTLSPHPHPSVVQWEGTEVHRFPRTVEVASCGISVSALGGFKALVEWADVIHYQFPWPFADFLHLFGKVKKPSVITYQSDIIRQQFWLKFYRPLMRHFLERVESIIATSPNYFATSLELKDFYNKVEIIPNGISEEIYPKVEDKRLEAMHEKYGDNFFLFVGVLRYYKGLHILLNAVQDTSLRVVIVGAGPVEKELKQQAARMRLANVHFLGHVSDEDKVALYSSCKAVVFPSHLRSEAFGMTLLEGAMFCKALISTEIGTGTSYVNSHEETGLVVMPSDSIELRKAMERLDQDPELAERMGKAARERYEQLFTGRRMAEQYTHLYGRIVTSSCR